MLIAISTHPDSQRVERFGHEFPIVLLNVDAQEIQSTRQLEPQSGCCRTLAQRLKGADVLLCTGVGQGAARHLSDFGVAVAVVPEGVAMTAALTSFLSQTLVPGEFTPTECTGHDGNHGEKHGESPEGGHCGCSVHETAKE